MVANAFRISLLNNFTPSLLAARINLSKGLLVSVALHSAIIASYYLGGMLLESSHKIVTVKFLDPNELTSAPPLDKAQPPPPVKVEAPQPVLAPVSGIPVIIPDEEASMEVTLQSQDELKTQVITSSVYDPSAEIKVDIEGALRDIGSSTADASEPDMNTFVPVEQLPVLIRQVNPEYPEIARQANMEGRVITRALINENGDVVRVVVLEGDEMFRDAAVKSLYQCKFKPAINGNRAIKVWISYPFTFRLK